MFGIAGIGLIFAIIQAVASEMPEQCRKLPPGVENPEDCCKMPILYSEEDMKDCNIDKTYKDIFKTFFTDCSKMRCLMKKHNLLLEDENTDKDAVAAFLDKLFESNADFKDALDKAKSRCFKEDLPGPPEICEPMKIAFCVKATLLDECPNWEENDNCKKFKDFINECKTYLPFE